MKISQREIDRLLIEQALESEAKKRRFRQRIELIDTLERDGQLHLLKEEFRTIKPTETELIELALKEDNDVKENRFGETRPGSERTPHQEASEDANPEAQENHPREIRQEPTQSEGQASTDLAQVVPGESLGGGK